MKADVLERILTAHEGGAWAPETLHELDAREEFPAEAVAVLDGAGLAASYVLTPDSDFPAMAELIRAVARRDLTVAIAHGKTFLGTVPVWIDGTPAQTRRLAGRVRAGDAVCWGLTERAHGSDLLAGELTATREDGAWRLDGEKYLINNGSRARLGTVLARTDPAGGGRGFSLFLVDRDDLPPTAWQALPKVPTHGIRGADISGFVLNGARVPADALIGNPGDGLGLVLRSLQLTRIACLGLSLGAADHALRLARDFVTGRELYGRRLSDLPHVRRTLGRAAAAALAAEAVSILAGRSVHELPGELSVTSAVAKAYVPTQVQELLGRLGELIGLRGFVVSPPGSGFAKLDRDHRICAVFDGSTVVNRTALLTQAPRLGRLLRRTAADTSAVRAAADLGTPSTPIDPALLTLTSATGCSLVQSLPEAVERIRGQGNPELTLLAETVERQSRELATELADFVPVSGGLPSGAFALAERYERLYAAAACLRLWLHNPARPAGALTRDALWPRACLTHLLDLPETQAYDDLAAVVIDWTAPAFTLLDGAV
ncbi:acyl-CoA dehydrogenase family protein [Streptomyces xylophagus]|uniref:acyl-CoA dehydrogenase family protein n=1 Tax=Streptomyces xylophagus TaxID=285514 RepID=UPI0005B95BA0|nr:acyl-CoA dehydrogenase [Streptomyces xylophagus]